MPLPDSVSGHFDMQVALLGGCLCVVEDRRSAFDVWVMRVYGSRDSWVKLFTLTQSEDVGSVKLKSVRPLVLEGDRVLFEQNRTKLCWYDLKSGNLSYVKVPGVGNTIEGTVSIGSLVPPNLLRDEESEEHRLGHDKNRKKRDDFLSQGFKLTL